MKTVSLCALGASLLFAPASLAQTTSIAIASSMPPGSAVLRTGTEVPLRLSEELTTKGKQLRVGQRFHMEVAEAVVSNGVTVIPVGSPAMGEITDVRNKGMWGKSGHLGARILYVTVNGRQIRLSGSFDDKGVTGTAGVIAAVAFVPVVGFFTTGTSAAVKSGASVKGFIDEDVPLTIAASQPVPMVVVTPAAPLQATASSTLPAATLTPAAIRPAPAVTSTSEPLRAAPTAPVTTATLTPAVATVVKN
jgi:hypothetical protein